MVKRKTKRSIAQSDNMLKASLAKREDIPTILREDEARYVGEVMIPAEDLGEPIINIAYEGNPLVGRDWYQRIRVTGEVNDLIIVLRSGGVIPQRVCLSKRDGKYWIVDGQQRFWAHSETSTPMLANVYACKTIEEEKRLFEVLNTRRGVAANTMIGAKGGWLTDLLLTANDEHPTLHGMFNFGRHHARILSASAVVRAIGVAVFGIHPNKAITAVRLVNRLTAKGEKDAMLRRRSEQFLELIAQVFITNRKAMKLRIHSRPRRIKSAAMMGLAAVAYENWSGRGKAAMPTDQQAQRLLNEANQIGIPPGRRYYVVYENAMRDTWPKKAKAA